MGNIDTFPVPHFPDLLRLDGKTFIIAGAGQGMGRQSAHALTQCGATVVCVDFDEGRAKGIADEVGGIAVHADVTDRAAVEAFVADAERETGRIDGLVDIVGIAEWARALEMDDDMWSRQIDVCLRQAFILGQVVGRRLVMLDGGTMVFIASVSGIDGAPNHAAYGSAKAGLMSWVRTLAIELGPNGVRVNAVAPGAIHTPRLHDVLSDEQKAAGSAATPLRRLGEPDDIAGAVLFLSTGLSSYVTGRTIVVDGGVDALFPYGGLDAGTTYNFDGPT